MLALYRDILRVARIWKAGVGVANPSSTAFPPPSSPPDSETLADRAYIREEARRLFKQNAKLTNPEEIEVSRFGFVDP